MSWAEERQVEIDHKTTLHHENGLMWSSCQCGWASQPRNARDNYQVTGASKDGAQHTNHMVGVERNKTFHRTALQSDF